MDRDQVWGKVVEERGYTVPRETVDRLAMEFQERLTARSGLATKSKGFDLMVSEGTTSMLREHSSEEGSVHQGEVGVDTTNNPPMAVTNIESDGTIAPGTQNSDEMDLEVSTEAGPVVSEPVTVSSTETITDGIDETFETMTQAMGNQPCEVVNQQTDSMSATAPVVEALDTAPVAMQETEKVEVTSMPVCPMKTRSSSCTTEKRFNKTAVVSRRRTQKPVPSSRHSESGLLSKGDINEPDRALVRGGKRRRLTPKHPPVLEEKPVENEPPKRGRPPKAKKPEPSVRETTGLSPEKSENGLQRPHGTDVEQPENAEKESPHSLLEERVPEMGNPTVSHQSVASTRRFVEKQEDGSGHEPRATRSKTNASEVKPAIDAAHKESEISSLDSPTVRPARHASHVALAKISYQHAEGVVSDDEETSHEGIALSTFKTTSSRGKRKRFSEAEASSSGDAVLATPSSTKVQPTEWDLVSVRTYSHPRTKLFWELIVKYASASPALSCVDIVEKIKEDISPGRFLRTCTKGHTLLAEEEIAETVGKALKKYRKCRGPSQVAGDHDVLSGSQPNHPGNIRFQDLVTKYMHESPTLTTSDLVEFIVKDIRPGRFLSENGFGWFPSTRTQIFAKVDYQRDKWRPLTPDRGDVGSTHTASSEQNTINAANTNSEAEIPQAFPCVSRVSIVPKVFNEQNIADSARKAREELMMKDTDDLLSSYVEDIAWRKFTLEGPTFENVDALPPPEPLPQVMTEADEPSCIWSFDEKSRILRVTLKPGVDSLSQKAKDHLFLMMERDDIAVITSGFCRDLNRSLWNDESIVSTSGEMYHHRFRRFVRIDVDDATSGAMALSPHYEEIDKDVSMRIGDYFKYLKHRQRLVEMTGEKEIVGPHLSYTYIGGEKIKLDLDEVIYMLDYDIKRKLPLHYQNFKDSFLFPEILPGGGMCAMNAVSNAPPRLSNCVPLTYYFKGQRGSQA
jgi:hypothetical protein